MKKIFLIFPLFLTACQTTVVQKPVVQEIIISSELLDCGDNMPPVPKYENLKNRDVGNYILALRKVIDECKSDTKTIKAYIEEYNKLISKFNEDNKK